MDHEHIHGHEHSHEHTHSHDHAHSHDHPHSHDHSHCHGEGDKVLALLTYMLDHNIHHCAELKDLGASLSGEAAHLLFHAVEAFDHANSYLAGAIEELKK